jgi:hypothetical protein
VLLSETVSDELMERDTNLVLLIPVVGAVAEDAGELVQGELRGVLVDEDRERGCRKHVGIVVARRGSRGARSVVAGGRGGTGARRASAFATLWSPWRSSCPSVAACDTP